MNPPKKQNKYIIIVFILILIVQIVIRVYAGYNKQNLFWDEALSYGLMNYQDLYISTKEDFFNQWHDAQYIKEYFEISKEEMVDLTPVYENQKNDVHPPIYYLLLRIAASFTIDSFTKWTGIILNIVISIFSTIVLYHIAKKILKNPWIALLACFAVMTTVAAVETTTFIRMYELCTLNFLLLTLWHITYYEKEIDTKASIFLILCIVTGFLTHYYYAIFAVGLGIPYISQLSSKKEKHKLMQYLLTVLIAILICLAIFPPLVLHIIHTSRGKEAFYNMQYIQDFFENLIGHFSLVTNDTIHLSFTIFTIITLLFIIFYLEIKNYRKRHNKKNGEERIVNSLPYNKLILFAVLFYIFIISKIAPYIEIRYTMPITPLFKLLIVCLLYEFLQQVFSIKFSKLLLLLFVMINFVISFAKVDNIYYSYKNDLEGMTEIKNKKPTIIFIQNIDNQYLSANYYYILYYSKAFYYTTEYNINLKELLKEVKEDEVYILVNSNDEEEQEYISNSIYMEEDMNIDFAYTIKDYNVYKVYEGRT